MNPLNNDVITHYGAMPQNSPSSPRIFTYPSEITEFRNELTYWSNRVEEILNHYSESLRKDQIIEMSEIKSQLNQLKLSFVNKQVQPLGPSKPPRRFNNIYNDNKINDNVNPPELPPEPKLPPIPLSRPQYPAPTLNNNTERRSRSGTGNSSNNSTHDFSNSSTPRTPSLNTSMDDDETDFSEPKRVKSTPKQIGNVKSPRSSRRSRSQRSSWKDIESAFSSGSPPSQANSGPPNGFYKPISSPPIKRRNSNKKLKHRKSSRSEHNKNKEKESQVEVTNTPVATPGTEVKLGLAMLKAFKFMEEQKDQEKLNQQAQILSPRSRRRSSKKSNDEPEIPNEFIKDFQRMKELAEEQQATIDRLKRITEKNK